MDKQQIKKQSISKNFIYQLSYQLVILFIPLILSPYLTRTLQEHALGIYTYANSIAYYFVMLAMLGIARHGQRIVSQRSTDEVALRKTFWSLFSVHIVVSLISLIAYLTFVLLFAKDSKSVYVIETFYVLSALFDITWFFYGLENFRSVVIKNATVKILECILIFIFVKSPKDINVYTLISAGGLLLGQVVMLPQAIRIVKPIRFSKSDLIEHIKPLLVFSISVIAVSLYTVFDKTLLGIMTTKENVAFYEYANRIVTIPKMVITVIGTVMFPRACRLAAQGNIEGQKKYMQYSFLFTAMIGMAAMFGLLAVARLFSLVYFGPAFITSGYVMMAMSPLPYIVGTGDILRTQYMIPNHMDKQFNICIFLNAIVNIIISFTLIPQIGIFGAVLGTTSAELFGIVYQVILCRKYIKIKDIALPLIPFVIIGALMLGTIQTVKCFTGDDYRALLIQVFVGAFVYGILSFVYVMIRNKDLRTVLFTKIKHRH